MMEDDPGWGFTWKSVPMMFVPSLAMRRMARDPSQDALLVLRSLFLTFCAAIVFIGGVTVTLGDMTNGKQRPGLSVTIAIVVGCACLLAQHFLPRPLDCTSPQSLAGSYRTRFFLRLAFAESAALIGFVLNILFGPWWVYFVAAIFTAIGFARLAPTRRHLEQDQEELSRNGCLLSLTSALRAAPSATR
jgi:hypothetical protein